MTNRLSNPSKCLDCGTFLDAVTGVLSASGLKPTPGSITICVECGHIMAFADDLSLRELNDQEMLGVAGNKDILDIQRARQTVIRDRRK